jgi:hypothetical protein
VRATFKRLFTDHPATVGETYSEHARSAASFGVSMLLGALACFLHALVPAFCTTTASRIIARLHDRMILNRSHLRSATQPVQTHPDSIAEHI